MKRAISILLLLSSGALPAAEPRINLPDIRDFLDKSEKVVSRLDADVTSDGVPDVIFVAASESRYRVMVLTRLHGKSLRRRL